MTYDAQSAFKYINTNYSNKFIIIANLLFVYNLKKNVSLVAWKIFIEVNIFIKSVQFKFNSFQKY